MLTFFFFALTNNGGCNDPILIKNRLRDPANENLIQLEAAEAFEAQFNSFNELFLETQELCMRKETIKANQKLIEQNFNALLKQRRAIHALLIEAIQTRVVGKIAALQYERKADFLLFDILSRIREPQLALKLIEQDDRLYANTTKLLLHSQDKARYYFDTQNPKKALETLTTAANIPYFESNPIISNSLAFRRFLVVQEICKAYYHNDFNQEFQHNVNPLEWYQDFFHFAADNGIMLMSGLNIWSMFNQLAKRHPEWVTQEIQATMHWLEFEVFPGYLESVHHKQSEIVINYFNANFDANQRESLKFDEGQLKRKETCNDIEHILKNLGELRDATSSK